MKKIVNLIIFMSITAYAQQPLFIGQRFILTAPETTHHRHLHSWLATTKPAGVMLLASHVRQRDDARDLISFLQSDAHNLGLPPLIIAIDWEGGIVSRPNERGGFYSVPSPWSLARAGRSACCIAGMLIGSQLHDIGVTMNFAPSLDTFDIHNPILATRCFSSDQEEIFECGSAYAYGLMAYGILPVIKHFPGLGTATTDTHHHPATLTTASSEPFDRMLTKDPLCIMATHAVAPQFGTLPVTLLPQAVDYLQKRNPQALLITDDFCMKAVHTNQSIGDAAWQSLSAGYHLIIFSGSTHEQENLINELQQRYDALTQEEQEGWLRTQNFIMTFKQQPSPSFDRSLDEPKTARFLAQRCVEIPENTPCLRNKKVTAITVNLPAIRPQEAWFIHHHKSFLARQLTHNGCTLNETLLDPQSPQSIDTLRDTIEPIKDTTDHILLQTFFYGDGIGNTHQKEWLNFLKPYQKRLIIISLGHPLEQTMLPHATIINLGSFHEPLLLRCAELLCAPHPLTGADRFIQEKETYLRGKKFGLLCHHCSVVHHDDATIFLPDALHAWAQSCHDGTKLVALFSPEHGLLGTAQAGASITSEQTTRWQCPCYSLHGINRQPTEEMLKDLDVLVVDLQDVGVRCFTYISTAKLVLEAAARAQLPVIILDRPNPLTIWPASGPVCQQALQSFLGALPISFIHGTTLGALMQHANISIGAHLTVIPCDSPNDPWSTTYRSPSPNLTSIDHVYAYPITVFLEGTTYSEGRGTRYPFLQIGAPWVNAQHLADTLNAQKMPGIFFEPITFTPHSRPGIADNPKCNGQTCHGIFLHIFDHAAVQPLTVAHEILTTLFALYPEHTRLHMSKDRFVLDLLLGADTWRLELVHD
ncbi:MAG: exo-beta-N-acetylmuramidase NamZ domain-containing protein [Candidatus Babeliales bacterium]|jgi:uncharacterized protein YbbC (DUF1343 family)/beta-glucosidase-like glycosyl hydrolase